MNQRRHHRPVAPKVPLDPNKQCSACVHCVKSTGVRPVMSCCLNPTQPQLTSFQRSARGACSPSGIHHKLPPVANLWATIKAFFRGTK